MCLPRDCLRSGRCLVRRKILYEVNRDTTMEETRERMQQTDKSKRRAAPGRQKMLLKKQTTLETISWGAGWRFISRRHTSGNQQHICYRDKCRLSLVLSRSLSYRLLVGVAICLRICLHVPSGPCLMSVSSPWLFVFHLCCLPESCRPAGVPEAPPCVPC